MLTGRPAPRQPRKAIELLVVGALTIDRFPDGSAAAGGSVLHATRAAARARASITVVTAAGPEPEAQSALSELKMLSTQRYVSPMDIALIYTGLGDRNSAFQWLEKAYGDRTEFLGWIKVDQRLDGLRPDPRFSELMRRVGLQQ